MSNEKFSCYVNSHLWDQEGHFELYINRFFYSYKLQIDTKVRLLSLKSLIKMNFNYLAIWSINLEFKNLFLHNSQFINLKIFQFVDRKAYHFAS